MNGEDGFLNVLSFSQWMDVKFGDDWPTADKDLALWNEYMEYVKLEIDLERN